MKQKQEGVNQTKNGAEERPITTKGHIYILKCKLINADGTI